MLGVAGQGQTTEDVQQAQGAEVIEQNVAEDIHRVEEAYTNFYLVEDQGGVTIVDACVPTAWDSLHEARRAIGRTPGDVRALVLTHAHFEVVTLDPYTAERGPKIVAGAATADSARNLATLDALAATGAGTVLTGHGEAWKGGVADAVARARQAGPF